MAEADTAPRSAPDRSGATRAIAAWVAESPAPAPRAREWAKHALLDWFGVTLAGSREPLSAILRDELAGGGPCTLLGATATTDAHHAALINGAAGHALDYDDVSREMYGHPTAPVAPTLLALAETGGASGAALLDALVAGVEVESAIGEMTGGGHYNLGFHATGTIGAFGAAAGAARLLRLDAEAAGRALGLAATQAAGLKCNFGTMAKPFHAGTAAAAGLLAARLAARGFTASDEAIEGPQGFLATQCPDSAPLPFRPDPSAPFWIERTLFKYHAACYSTHGTIEAVRALRARHGIGLSDMEAMTLHVHPRHLEVCNIAEPRTGLEMKFSLRQLAVAALDGRDTAALETFSDAPATDPRYVTARRRVAVETDPDRDRLTTRVEIRLMDGRHLAEDTDVGQPATDLPAQWDRLAAKFASLATPVIGAAQAVRAVAAVAALDRATDISGLIVALR